MNYYERHLGDYAKDTAHLTMIEHGAYTLLMDRYYATEAGIPEDQAYRVSRARTKEEKAAVDVVLDEFFRLENGVWIKNRIEEEIEKAQTKITTAQKNGKLGGRPKKDKTETQEKPTGLFVGSKTETQKKAHQTPDTNHHTPDIETSSNTQPVYARENDDVSRPVQIAVLLNANGAKVQAQNPTLIEWANAGFTDSQLLEALCTAKGQRSKDGNQQPVNAGYLNSILRNPRKDSIHDQRANTIAELTGRNRTEPERKEIDITPVADGLD